MDAEGRHTPTENPGAIFCWPHIPSLACAGRLLCGRVSDGGAVLCGPSEGGAREGQTPTEALTTMAMAASSRSSRARRHVGRPAGCQTGGGGSDGNEGFGGQMAAMDLEEDLPEPKMALTPAEPVEMKLGLDVDVPEVAMKFSAGAPRMEAKMDLVEEDEEDGYGDEIARRASALREEASKFGKAPRRGAGRCRRRRRRTQRQRQAGAPRRSGWRPALRCAASAAPSARRARQPHWRSSRSPRPMRPGSSRGRFRAASCTSRPRSSERYTTRIGGIRREPSTHRISGADRTSSTRPS